LKTQDFIRLLRTQDIAGMSDSLLTSDYSTELSRIPTTELNALQLERMFYEKLSQRWYSLLRITSGKLKELLETNAERLETENLKRIIRAVHGKAEISNEQLISIPRQYQEVNFPALLAASEMTDVVELLKESPYRDVEKRLVAYETYGNPALLEAQLDKIYYDDVWAKTSETPDSEKIRALIGTEVDLRNLRWILSSKYMKLEPWLVHENVIDVGYRLRKSAVSRLIDLDVQEMPHTSVPPRYFELIRRAVELIGLGKIVETENLFSQHLYSYAEKVSIRNPNSLVYVFSYLQLCFREARNLTTLAIGKQMKMSENRLADLLFL
jgi:vacuolar-type H+-ATPase subunit C/Vma6